jgi:CubicO group peptidase (beta-lactamase class C family)
MQHLLTHQGGFEDFVDWEPADSLMEFALTTFPEESGQMNPAGKFYNYSNPNWSYVGAIIEYSCQTNRVDSQPTSEHVSLLPFE